MVVLLLACALWCSVCATKTAMLSLFTSVRARERSSRRLSAIRQPSQRDHDPCAGPECSTCKVFNCLRERAQVDYSIMATVYFQKHKHRSPYTSTGF